MVTLRCPVANCGRQVVNRDMDLLVATYRAHISTHTADTNQDRSNGPSKGEKISRPRITRGMSVEAWNSFQVRWGLYKTGTRLSESEYSLQLLYCCDKELLEQLLQADPGIADKPEVDQLESIRKLAVVPVALGVRRAGLLNMTQKADELSRSFLAKVQGKAATCGFTTKCTEECCSGEGKSTDFTNTIVKYVLVNGLVDTEIRREVLGWKRLDESSLMDTVAFIEQKEMARDAIKGEAVAMKTGYRKQQAIASPAVEVRPRKRIKCGRCETQINQHIRMRSGKLRERKLCGQCWKATSQKHYTTENSGKADEASTLFVSSTWAASNQGGGTTKATNKNRTRKENHRVSLADKIEVAVTHSKEGAAIVLDHHIFDSRAGWVRRKAWSQPMLRLSVRPCRDMYSKLNVPTPDVNSMVVDGTADTGAQVCLWSAADFYKSGYKKRDLVKVEQRVSAANRQSMEILGAVFLALESNSLKTNLMAFVTPDIHGMYLSRQVLTELYVIPRSFPRAGDAKVEPEDKESTPTVAAVSDRAPCGCLLRREPPARPSKLPFPCAVSNIPKMKQWLLETFAASTFNKCPHQSLPFIKAEPITLHVDKEAKPVAQHTPCILPIHWRDKIKAGLDDDERLGVLEKVPDGVPTTWLHRMVVVPKPSGEPRRTVDLSPLNKFCKRETHVTVPPSDRHV